MFEVRCRIGSERGEVAMVAMPMPTFRHLSTQLQEFLPKQREQNEECQIILFSTEVLIDDIIFMSHSGDRTVSLHSHLTHTNILQFAGQRKCLHFFVVLRFGV